VPGPLDPGIYTVGRTQDKIRVIRIHPRPPKKLNSYCLVFGLLVGFFLLCFQFLFNHGLQAIHVSVPHSLTIYIYRRHASDTHPNPFLIILLDSSGNGGVFLMTFNLCLVQFQLPSNLLNFLIIETRVIFEQLVVKFPEFTLAIGRQGGCGGLNCIFMASNRKVFVNQFYGSRIFLEQLLKLRRKPCTVPSLKVTENRYDDRRVLRSFEWRSRCVYSVYIIELDDFH